jgi:integrase
MTISKCVYCSRRGNRDQGPVFAKEERGPRDNCQGDPLQANNVAEREFEPLIEKAVVRRSKFHGLHHAATTLALQAGCRSRRFRGGGGIRGLRL